MGIGEKVCKAQGFPGGSGVKNLLVQQEMQILPLGQEDHLEEAWQPTPVFLPGKSDGQRSLAGYSPWGHNSVGQDLVIKTLPPSE